MKPLKSYGYEIHYTRRPSERAIYSAEGFESWEEMEADRARTIKFFDLKPARWWQWWRWNDTPIELPERDEVAT